MAFLKKYIMLSVVALGIPMLSFAQDSRAKISLIEKEIQAQEVFIDAGRKNLTEKTKEIEKIKKSDGSRLVSKILLQKKLREAQVVSKDLELNIKKLTRMSQELQKEKSILMSEIDIQIKQLTSSKEPHQLAQLQQLQQLIAEKDELMEHQQKIIFNLPNFNLSSVGDEKEDLVEKLHVVEDLQKSMLQKIAFLKNELAEEKSREFLRSEVSHFIDEENFFGEQSFISSGIVRKDTSKVPSVMALKKESAAANSNTPTVDPSSIPATGGDSTTSPSANTDVGDNSSNSMGTLSEAPQTTSESTSFQQPAELGVFETLLDQVQESIRDTNPKVSVKKTDSVVAKSKKVTRNTKRGSLEQNLALSQKILSDLDILRQNLTHQIHTLD
jgi:hypothetical protein